MDWCLAEPLGIIIFPPLVDSPASRSADLADQILDQFPLTAERYRARDVTGDGRPETFCNFFTRDYMRARGTHLPEGMTANRIWGWLHATQYDFIQVPTAADMNALLAAGRPGFAIAPNPEGPGHMVPCRRGGFHDNVLCNHVGGHNVPRITISQAFGPLTAKVELWAARR